jgi:serine/threonine protein kinase
MNVEDKVMPNEILSLIRINSAPKELYSEKCLIKLYEVYEEEEYVHLVMDYCEGGSLRGVFNDDDEDSDDGNADEFCSKNSFPPFQN